MSTSTNHPLPYGGLLLLAEQISLCPTRQVFMEVNHAVYQPYRYMSTSIGMVFMSRIVL
jgi:hypothetical protein